MEEIHRARYEERAGSFHARVSLSPNFHVASMKTPKEKVWRASGLVNTWKFGESDTLA